MSEITYISKEVSVVEGFLTAEDSKVVVAGSFSGNINANEVILEEGSKFEGEVDARVDGELLTNSIEVASGAEIAGSISRIS